MEGKEIARKNAELDWSDQRLIETVKATVAKNATNEELEMFLYYCKSTGLNPFRKEIWFFKDNQGRPIMMTGINGFYRIGNSHPQFNGMTTSTTMGPDGMPVVSICKVYRKDWEHPVEGVAYWKEYAKLGNPAWRQYSSRMLEKCAEALALRKAFPQELGGLYVEEEIDAISPENTIVVQGSYEVAPPPVIKRRYDITPVAEDQIGAVLDYLTREKAVELGGNIYESDHELKRLRAYEVKSDPSGGAETTQAAD